MWKSQANRNSLYTGIILSQNSKQYERDVFGEALKPHFENNAQIILCVKLGELESKD